MPGKFWTQIGTEEQIGWLETIAKAVIVINLLDGVLTLTWISMGVATEANQLMRDVASGHPVVFMMTKLTLVSFGSYLLWRYRTRPLAAVGLIVIFICYYGILLLHARYVGFLLRGFFDSL